MLYGKNNTFYFNFCKFSNINNFGRYFIYITSINSQIHLNTIIFNKINLFYIQFSSKGFFSLINCYSDRDDHSRIINSEFHDLELYPIQDAPILNFTNVDIREWWAAGGQTVSNSLTFKPSNSFTPSNEFTIAHFDLYDKDWVKYKRNLKSSTVILLTSIFDDIVLSL